MVSARRLTCREMDLIRDVILNRRRQECAVSFAGKYEPPAVVDVRVDGGMIVTEKSKLQADDDGSAGVTIAQFCSVSLPRNVSILSRLQPTV